MINRRGGATTSLILGIAGVIGVGVAGGMAVTGTTPCSIMSACGIKPATPAAQAVALQGETTTCPITGKSAVATTVALTGESDCCASKKDAAPVAQTVVLTAATECNDAKADCSNDPECAVDDGIACSTKGDDCHKVQDVNANGVQVQVVTASQTTAKGEECAMAASCAPENCTEGMMKACTDSGKICPEDKSAQPVVQTIALADCSGDPECAVDDGVACSTKGDDCHKVQPAAQTVAETAKAASCCSSTGKAAMIAAASKPAAEIVFAPDALRKYRVLSFTGRGMPMLIPAALTTASSCETKDAGSCGGEKAGSCSDEKKAEPAATATTASLN